MKREFTYTMVLACMLTLLSCQETFFDEVPEDQFTEAIFYKQARDFEQAINAGYLSLRTSYRQLYVIGDIASDNAYNWKNNNNFDYISINESNVSADNGVLNTQWNAGYATIARANIVIDRIGGIAMDEQLRKQYIGEAQFLRALSYFNLVRIFGAVPLVVSEIKTSEEAFALGRENVDKVYQTIVSDLQEAIKNLPEAYTKATDKGRANGLAAKSLLGKVYLTQKKYAEAGVVLKEVISTGKASLLDDYAKVFDPNNGNNAEIIFAVQYARNLDPIQGSPFGNDVAPNEPVGRAVVSAGSGLGNFHMTTDLFSSFDKKDKRLTMVDSATGGQRKYYFTKKYFDPAMTKANDAANDWIVLRYADVLLMAAEAITESGGSVSEAISYLNQVRMRAGLDAVAAGTSIAALRPIIVKERRLELNCEGERWFDLVRTGTAMEVMNKHFAAFKDDVHQVGQNSSIQAYEILFPVPISQVVLNPGKIQQNEGY